MKFIISICILLIFSFAGFSTDYFVCSLTGNDSNSGLSSESAIASLTKASEIKLNPGDRLLFYSGDVFKGQLRLAIRGSENQPVMIGKYGGDKFPVIDGDGAESAIFLKNASNLTIQELQIKNWKGKYGIQFVAEDAGEMKNIIFQDLDIRDVGYETTTVTEPSKTIGGICGRALKGTKPSWWNGLTIRRVYIHHVGSCGITFGNEVNLYKLEKDDPYYRPHLNVKIEDCRIDSIVRDGIWIRQCDGATIQNCEVSRTGMNAISNGIWFWDCLNSIMQYNEGWECRTPQGNDGAPFSIDNHCWNCVIQYNYSHDNDGPGYMVFGRMGDNGGNIIRDNLSYNDCVYKNYKPGTACISAISEVKDALIEGNIVVAGQDTHYILGHRNWEGFPHSVTYKNNLFIGNGRSVISELDEVLKTGTFDGNFFVNIPNVSKILTDSTSKNNYLRHFEKIRNIMNASGKR
jgi:hypothetical protein